MSAYEMLLKAGYTPEEAANISGWRPPVKSQREIAEENERKYSCLGMSAEERIVERIEGNRRHVYEDIKNNNLVGAGICTTDRGYIRRCKYGKGNISKRKFLQMPIAQEDAR